MELPMYPKEEDERDQARADEQALADLRVCEAWEDNHPTMGTIHIAKCVGGFTAHIYDDFHAVLIVPGLPAATRDAARGAAAAWVRAREGLK